MDFNFFDKDCNGTIKSQALCLGIWILYNALQHVISPKKRHADIVTQLDLALLDSILKGRGVNVGFVIFQLMLSTTKVWNITLLFDSIITRTLEHFQVPVVNPTFQKPRELRDNDIASLGFVQQNDNWVSNPIAKNMSIFIAPTDSHLLNDVFVGKICSLKAYVFI